MSTWNDNNNEYRSQRVEPQYEDDYYDDGHYEPDYRDDDYSYDQSIYDACDGMEDAYWNID